MGMPLKAQAAQAKFLLFTYRHISTLFNANGMRMLVYPYHSLEILRSFKRVTIFFEECKDMNSKETSETLQLEELTSPVSQDTIAQLVGQVYESVPPAEQSRLIEFLLKPLGVLSLVSVANGIFANIRLRGDWSDIHVQPEDAQNVQVSDVITLVIHVQQISVHAINGLAHMLASSPVMTGSAAAALLMTILVQRAQTRRASDCAVGDSVALPD